MCLDGGHYSEDHHVRQGVAFPFRFFHLLFLIHKKSDFTTQLIG